VQVAGRESSPRWAFRRWNIRVSGETQRYKPGNHRLDERGKPSALRAPLLDVLFLALNPPVQSNANGHYFSGQTSRFYHLLFLSGLITEALPKACADDVVFGTTSVNYNQSAFGVADLVNDLVETDSGGCAHYRTKLNKRW